MKPKWSRVGTVRVQGGGGSLPSDTIGGDAHGRRTGRAKGGVANEEDGTAAAGENYQEDSGFVRWQDGENASQIIQLQVSGAADLDERYFFVYLEQLEGAVYGQTRDDVGIKSSYVTLWLGSKSETQGTGGGEDEETVATTAAPVGPSPPLPVRPVDAIDNLYPEPPLRNQTPEGPLLTDVANIAAIPPDNTGSTVPKWTWALVGLGVLLLLCVVMALVRKSRRTRPVPPPHEAEGGDERAEGQPLPQQAPPQAWPWVRVGRQHNNRLCWASRFNWPVRPARPASERLRRMQDQEDLSDEEDAGDFLRLGANARLAEALRQFQQEERPGAVNHEHKQHKLVDIERAGNKHEHKLVDIELQQQRNGTNKQQQRNGVNEEQRPQLAGVHQ
eukprot:g77785.t1